MPDWNRSSFCQEVTCVEVAFVKSSFSGGGNCVEVGVDMAYQRSSFSASGNCVEVDVAEDRILLRDSKDPNGPVLIFTPGEWDAFVLGAKNDEFDFKNKT